MAGALSAAALAARAVDPRRPVDECEGGAEKAPSGARRPDVWTPVPSARSAAAGWLLAYRRSPLTLSCDLARTDDQTAGRAGVWVARTPRHQDASDRQEQSSG